MKVELFIFKIHWKNTESKADKLSLESQQNFMFTTNALWDYVAR